MKKRRYTKQNKLSLSKTLIAVIIISFVSLSSLFTVMAISIPCTVIDGEHRYEFSLINPEFDGIIETAVNEGMPPIGESDTTYTEDGIIHIKRGLNVTVNTAEGAVSIITYEGDTVKDTLEANSIEYTDKDLIEPHLQAVILEDTVIDVKKPYVVTVTSGIYTHNTVMYEGTVSDAINTLGIEISDTDRVEPSLDTVVADNIDVNISTLKKVDFSNEGEVSVVETYVNTIDEFIAENEIEIANDHHLEPSAETYIYDGIDINLNLVEIKEVTETEPLIYQTIKNYTDELYVGEKLLEIVGSEGKKEFVYEEKYLNGELVDKVLIEEIVVREPVDRVVNIGTKEREVTEENSEDTSDENTDEETTDEETTEDDTTASANTFVDHLGNTVSYSGVMVGECTAYSIPGGITSTGQVAQVGIVAVNPDVIPYGTRMYITNGNIVYGYAVAGDTGGALLSNRVLVDLFYDTEEECINFGRRDMTVYILD